MLRITLLLAMNAAALTAFGAQTPDQQRWYNFDKLSAEVAALEGELKTLNAAREAIRQTLKSPELDTLRQAIAEAEKAVTAAHTQAGLDELRDKLHATQAARGQAADALVANAPTYQAILSKAASLRQQLEALEQRSSELSADQWLEQVRIRNEILHIDRTISGARKSLWRRGEVEPKFKAADVAYKAYHAQAGKPPEVQAANEKLKAARKAFNDAMNALPLESAAAKELLNRSASLETRLTEAKAKLADQEKTLLEGKTVTVTIKAFDRKAKAEVDKKVSLWMPNQTYIRGIVIAHPMISALANGRTTKLAAARESLGTMVFDHFASHGKESLATLDALFEKLAEASGHPELKGAPILLGGLSASVLGTRNVACAVPERVFGVVHAAGGNMQEMPDDGRGMIQVPFLALNGEFEWCGPIGGIRPEYGLQTQWVMIREQMLRLWRDKHEHRMSLIVVPNADHGAWDHRITALFIRKAAQYRLPKEKRDGSTPAVCAPLPANQGWLTDADLDHPKHDPAPYDKFTGDKNHAFWHFDEEMAHAIYNYHKGRFILPDPTKASPVPADWPPKAK